MKFYARAFLSFGLTVAAGVIAMHYGLDAVSFSAGGLTGIGAVTLILWTQS